MIRSENSCILTSLELSSNSLYFFEINVFSNSSGISLQSLEVIDLTWTVDNLTI